MTSYEKRNRITAIVRKVLGITTLKTGSKRKVMESHGFNEELRKPVRNILDKRKEKLGEYHVNEELFDKLTDVIDSYNGKISLVSALGILELVKDRLKDNNNP